MKYEKLFNELQERASMLHERLDAHDRLGLEESMKQQTGELSMYDNHPADSGTELFERSKDLALYEQLKNEQKEVNEALQKIKDGSYGICEVSGEVIPYERLEANPTAKTLIEYAKDETKRSRPVEEEVLKEIDHINDGENAYEIVASFNEIDEDED